LEHSLCVVSSWVIRVYTILVWNTSSGSSSLDNYFYHCLILITISHLKTLFNLLLLLLLLLFIIYVVNLSVVRPRSCRVIYYFDTPTLRRRHQSFGRVTYDLSQLASETADHVHNKRKRKKWLNNHQNHIIGQQKQDSIWGLE
jgi:hypothetical protein